MASSMTSTYSIKLNVVTAYNRLCYFHCHQGNCHRYLTCIVTGGRGLHPKQHLTVERGLQVLIASLKKRNSSTLPCQKITARQNDDDDDDDYDDDNDDDDNSSIRIYNVEQTIECSIAWTLDGMISKYFASECFWLSLKNCYVQ